MLFDDLTDKLIIHWLIYYFFGMLNYWRIGGILDAGLKYFDWLIDILIDWLGCSGWDRLQQGIRFCQVMKIY